MPQTRQRSKLRQTIVEIDVQFVGTVRLAHPDIDILKPKSWFRTPSENTLPFALTMASISSGPGDESAATEYDIAVPSIAKTEQQKPPHRNLSPGIPRPVSQVTWAETP